MPFGMKVDQRTDMLAIIDVQPTFMPGGELPVEDGGAVVPVINRLLHHRFHHACATQDWHPPGHSSFASTHPSHRPFDTVTMSYGPQLLWPDHAVQGTANAALHPDLDTGRIELVLRKGCRAELDSYSAFRENDGRTSTGLKGWLVDRGVRRLFLTGLAGDYCVAWSATDAVEAGFETVVVEDATRSIGMALPDGRSDVLAHARLHALGVIFLRSSDLD